MMKILLEIYRAIRIARRFWRQQHATFAMLNGTYVRKLAQDELVVIGNDTTLSIEPFGSLYQITRTDYVANEPERVQTWLASYGFINMHLTEINFDRYFVFDTASNSIYVATMNDQGDTVTELFTKNI